MGGKTPSRAPVLSSHQKKISHQKKGQLIGQERQPTSSQGKLEKVHKEKLSDVLSSKQVPALNKKKYEDESHLQYAEESIFYGELPFRIEGEKLKQILHRSVVALTFLNVHKNLGAGSGALISRNIILTAAHNLYQRNLKRENSNFKIYIGANGVGEEYYQIESWRYPKEFQTCPAQNKGQFDYAIMKLKKPVEFDQFLSLSLACQQCLTRDNEKIMIRVFGFPRAYPPGTNGINSLFEDNFKALDQYGKRIKLFQYGLARQGRIAIIDADQKKIGYGISTLPGQSGSPVIAGNQIIAVHVGGEVVKKFNVGRIIDENVISKVNRWILQLNGESLSLEEEENICEHNKQTVLRFTSTTLLKKLIMRGKDLKKLNLQEYVNLLQLDLEGNLLRQIDLAHCPCLTKVDLSENQLQRIDLTNNKYLTDLHLQSNQFEEIDVRANIYLKQVRLQKNKLLEIDLRANTNLGWLYMHSNKLQKIDLSPNTCLVLLSLYSNQLQDIDLRNNINLIWLHINSNNIKQIDLTNNIKLESLTLEENKLESVIFLISENVEEDRYCNYFNLANQQSATCQVQLICEGQAIREKATKACDKWRQLYSQKKFNRHNCKYTIEIS